MKSTTKKLIAALLSVIMIVACFAACTGKTGDGGSASGDTLKIGGTGPLTGGNASYGTSVKNAAELAIEEINNNGGVNGMKLQLLFEDDEADGAKAKTAFEKLMDNGMQIMMGAVTSGASIALNDLVKQEGLLQITPSGSAKDCTQNPNAFRICFTDPMQGELMAQYIIDQGITKVAIIYNQDDTYSTGINDAFKTKYAALGGTVAAETSFAKDAKDFNAQLTKIKGTDAQGIFMPIYNEKAAQIAIASNEKGIKLPMFGCDGWDGILEKYLITPEQAALIEGATYLTPFTASDANPAIQSFVKAYQAKFGGATPDQFAADAYDAIYTIKAALEKVNIQKTKLTAEDNQALVKAMTEIEINGLTGKMTFTPEGEPNKGAKVAKIVNGQYQVIVQ